jgi:hypothetical protein
MRKLKANRKARFKAALALTGMTQQQWAEREKVTRQHLGAVLRDDRESGSLIAKVDAFIAEVAQQQKSLAA